jgi:hypothetical protein
MRLTIAKAAALCLALALICWPSLPQTDSDRDWTDKHFPTALDELFPVRHADGDFIAVRAHQNGSYEVAEFSFVLEDTQDPHTIHATLREAQGASVYQQLLALHAKQPEKSYDDLKRDLKVQIWKLSAAQCPAVAAQFKAFENITFVRPHDDDPVDEHPILYEIGESVGGGDSQVVEFIESRAIPRWANATRKALDSCVASVPAADKYQYSIATGSEGRAILSALSPRHSFLRSAMEG